MHKLSKELLIEIYLKASALDLDQDFIKLIEQELIKRGIPIPKIEK